MWTTRQTSRLLAFSARQSKPEEDRSKDQEDDAYARGIAGGVDYCDDEERDAC